VAFPAEKKPALVDGYEQ